MYAGLTTADKCALKEAEKYGRGCIYLPRIDRLVDTHIALAQIAEMEAERKPMTVNEWLNQATPEQKAEWLLLQFPYLQAKAINMALRDNINGIFSAEYKRRVAELLNSPYTEGETK